MSRKFKNSDDEYQEVLLVKFICYYVRTGDVFSFKLNGLIDVFIGLFKIF